MIEINLVCRNHKLLNSLFPPKGDKKLYLLDNMLPNGKPFILDWAIPQEEGVPGSQVARLQLWHNRGKTLAQRNTSEGFWSSD